MNALEDAGGGWVRTCRLAGLGEDRPVHADIGECPVCLVRTGGVVYALRDECTHESVPLSDGDVAGGAIECWKHGSRFDLATGRVLSPPATRPVAVFGVRIDGEDVYVQLSPGGNGGLARRPGVRPPGASRARRNLAGVTMKEREARSVTPTRHRPGSPGAQAGAAGAAARKGTDHGQCGLSVRYPRDRFARRELAPAIHQAFDAFSQQVFADGALPAKTKQLIAVAAAHVTQCPYCIRGHTKLAHRAGASDEEIMEAIWVAAEMRAGGAFAHSTVALHALAEEQP